MGSSSASGPRGPPQPSAAPSQGKPQHHVPRKNQSGEVAPAPPVLLTTVPSYQDIVGHRAQMNIAGMATAAGAPSGSSILPGSDIALPSPSADPHLHDLGDLAEKLAVPDKEPLKESIRLLGCSPDTVGVSQEGPGSSPMPGDPGGTGREGSAVATAPPVLPTSITGNRHVEGQPAHVTISGTGTPAGTTPGSNIPPPTDVPPSPRPAPLNQHPGDPAGDLAVPEEVPLEEALRIFDCFLDTMGVSHDGASSSPMPGDHGGIGIAIPPCDFASLSLPEQRGNSSWPDPPASAGLWQAALGWQGGTDPVQG